MIWVNFSLPAVGVQGSSPKRVGCSSVSLWAKVSKWRKDYLEQLEVHCRRYDEGSSPVFCFQQLGCEKSRWGKEFFYQVIPTRHFPFVNWSLDGEDPRLAESFIPNIGILPSHPYHCWGSVWVEWGKKEGEAHLQAYVWDDPRRWEKRFAGNHRRQILQRYNVVNMCWQGRGNTNTARLTCFHHVFATINHNGNYFLFCHRFRLLFQDFPGIESGKEDL